jgi:hypothetical protein
MTVRFVSDAVMAAEIAVCAGKVAALRFPTLSPVADPDELLAARDFLVALYAAVDPLIEAAGRELKSAIRQPFSLDPFRRQLEGALQDNATYELERAAEREHQAAAAEAMMREDRGRRFPPRAARAPE